MAGFNYPVSATSSLDSGKGAASLPEASAEKPISKNKHRQFRFIPGKPVKRRKTAHGNRMTFDNCESPRKPSNLNRTPSKHSKKITFPTESCVTAIEYPIAVPESRNFDCMDVFLLNSSGYIY